jgi:hypothetical protein
MATIIESTIGSGGAYPDIPTWWASVPTNMITADQVHRGLLLNQEFVITASIVFSGKTADATRYPELTAAPGCSFMDHANRATNPGRYNASVGAAIRCTAAGATINVQQSFMRITKLQVANTNTGSTAQPAFYTSGAGVTNITTDNCIFESYGVNTSIKAAFRMTTAASFVRNCYIAQLKNDAAAVIAAFTNGTTVVNCTLVNLGATPLTYGIITGSISAIMKNCYVGGVVAPEDGVIAATKTACYSNATATNYSVAALSTGTFQNISIGTHDLRLATTSPLLNVGTTDVSNASADIVGTTRPQGAAYDVGAWESAASTPSATITYTEDVDVTSVTASIYFSTVSASCTYTEVDDVHIISTNVVVTSITSSVSYTEANDTHTVSGSSSISSTVSWAEVNDTSSITGSVTTVTTITTAPFKNNTGSVLANLTSLTVTVLNITTLTYVSNFTARTTDASGVLTISNAGFTPGVQYVVVVSNAAGVLGVEKYTAV